ncbi:MAG: hypothetical protein HQ534_09030 [Armatimonadetes bacterium]|nr:hypothetical protein [Armatimonadota bacterium]
MASSVKIDLFKYKQVFVHFAFSSLKDDPEGQINSLEEFILEPKALRFRKNPEFIPVFRPHITPRFKGKKVIHIEPKRVRNTDYGADVNLWEESKRSTYDISFHRENIGMVCFIKISIKQLKSSPHSDHYGRLGLVFRKKFLIKKGIRLVQYYQEESLYNDTTVLEWNHKFAYRPNLSPEDNKRKRELEIQILAFRKPSKLFNSFSESRSIVISQNKVEIKDAYDRYNIGYDFQKENEWRITQQNNEYIEFSERDLQIVIAPDINSKNELKGYFKRKWTIKPIILVHSGD